MRAKVGENPSHVAELLKNRNRSGAKPQTQHRSDTGRSLYIASGRLDLQHSARSLEGQMSKTLRMCDLWLGSFVQYRAGKPHLPLVFKHEVETHGSRIPVDSQLAEKQDRYSPHDGCEFARGHLLET